MPETALAGKGGTVYIPGTPVTPIADVHEWTLKIDAGNYDASVLGDSWRHFVPGLRGWSGSISGYYDVVLDTNGQQVLYNACLNSGTVVIVMQTVAGGGSFEGTVNITTMTITDPVDGLITLVFDYVGTGSLQHSP